MRISTDPVFDPSKKILHPAVEDRMLKAIEYSRGKAEIPCAKHDARANWSFSSVKSAGRNFSNGTSPPAIQVRDSFLLVVIP